MLIYHSNKMKEYLFLFILFTNIILLGALEVNPQTFKALLSTAESGSILELTSGTYKDAPYKLSNSGKVGNPITIKLKSQDNVKFESSNEGCIFELDRKSYINIEGEMELSNAECGIKVVDSNNIIITGLKLHDMKKEAIIASGENIEILNNEIYNCVLDSKDNRQSIIYGTNQCTKTLGINQNSEFSKNITFKNNNIYNGYGEGIKFSYCDGCSAISNTIKNTLSINVYLYSSKDTLIQGNIIKVTNNDYNSKFGKAIGIGLSTDSTYDIENVEIQNNLIIGCRIGIYYFITGTGSYKAVNIYHNTLWKIDITPIWFTEPIKTPSTSKLYNNFIYHNKQSHLLPKSNWEKGYNIFYNTDKVPPQYEDSNSDSGTSNGIGKMSINEIFNNLDGKCDYNNNMDLNISCFRPNSNDKTIYHTGKKINEDEKDIEGCSRENKPSIGAFESPEGCEVEPIIDNDVAFKIHYITGSGEVVQLIGTLCNWNETGKCITLEKNSDNYWKTVLKSGTTKFFEYKFAIFNGSKVTRWENNHNRNFNGQELAKMAEKETTGTYGNCNYIKSGNIITLTCSWQE